MYFAHKKSPENVNIRDLIRIRNWTKMFSYLMPILGCTGPRSGNWKLKPNDPLYSYWYTNVQEEPPQFVSKNTLVYLWTNLPIFWRPLLAQSKLEENMYTYLIDSLLCHKILLSLSKKTRRSTLIISFWETGFVIEYTLVYIQ